MIKGWIPDDGSDLGWFNLEKEWEPRMDAEFFSKYLQSPRIEPDIYIPALYLKKSVIYFHLGSTFERMLFILFANLI